METETPIVEGADERDWSDLPADLVRRCVTGVPCSFDRMNIMLQCRAWCDAVRPLPRLPQLPWMLIPYCRTCFHHQSVIRKAHFICFISSRSHTVRVPNMGFGARFIGSVEGGWVLLAMTHNSGYMVVNFRTGAMLLLPDYVAFGRSRPSEPVILHAADFSSSSAQPESCVVACIVSTFDRPFLSRTMVCFSCFGASLNSCGVEMDFEDIIYFYGSFYRLTEIEDMLRCTPRFDPSSFPDSLGIEHNYIQFRPLRLEGDWWPKGRYLVLSQDELLMVVRYNTPANDSTCQFALFRPAPASLLGSENVWQRLQSLDGRIIFVGRGCLRCYETRDYPGRHERVYFVDDETFSQPAMVAYGRKGRKYQCYDNGSWPGEGFEVRRLYDWRVPSSYTPPIWFLQ